MLELQQTLKETQAQLKSEKYKAKKLKKTSKQTALTPTPGNADAQDLSAEKIAERSEKLADMTARGIKKQMKWQVCQ